MNDTAYDIVLLMIGFAAGCTFPYVRDRWDMMRTRAAKRRWIRQEIQRG